MLMCAPEAFGGITRLATYPAWESFPRTNPAEGLWTPAIRNAAASTTLPVEMSGGPLPATRAMISAPSTRPPPSKCG